MPDIDLSRLWETLKSSGTQTSLLVAIIGQIFTAIYFQIANNERQEAAIAANMLALQEWKNRDAALNTEFGKQFLKLEATVNDAIRRGERLETPLGQRFIVMESRANEAINIGRERLRQAERMADQLNQLTERITTIDKRLLEMELKQKEQQPK